jgi:adenosine deaminase
VAASFGMTLGDIKRLTIAAAESAFLPDEERQALVDRFKLQFGGCLAIIKSNPNL